MEDNLKNVSELKQKIKKLQSESRHELRNDSAKDIAFYKKLLEVYEQLIKLTQKIETV